MDPSALPQSAQDHLYPVLLIVGLAIFLQAGIIAALWRLFRWLLGQMDERIALSLHEDKLKPLITPIVTDAVSHSFEHVNGAVIDLSKDVGRAMDRAEAAHRRLDLLAVPRAP